MVEKSDERPIKRSFNGYKILWGLEISKDILVYTESEFRAAAEKEASLSYKVKQAFIHSIQAYC